MLRSLCLWFMCLGVCLGVLYSSDRSAQADEQPIPIGKPAPEIALSDFGGKEWTSADFADKKVVVVAFLGVECPLVQQYAGRLGDMAREWAPKGVAFVGVNSNQQDSLAEIAHLARTHKIEFPLLKDPGNRLADGFGAQRTPEIFVLDSQRVVRYHGAIDDQYTYGRQRPEVKANYLKDAIQALLDGTEPAVPETEVLGCHIGRVFQSQDANGVTYHKQISRILQNRCVECHRPGEIGPFSLTSYEDVVGWAEMIDEVVREQRMPPWHANPAHGSFVNDARLSDEEKQQITDWVNAGAPEGDPADAPEARQFAEGWRMGEPDLVVYMRDEPFTVPARGEVKYQYFLVDPGFKEDTWVQAAECRPGNRSVVHHILVGLAPAERSAGPRGRVHGELSQWIAAMAPGARPLMLSPGYAKLIPAGSKLVFQMHYTANGVEQQDRSCVGFKFADPKTVKKEVRTLAAANGGFRIPPGAAHHEVEAAHTFTEDTLMLAMFPHMHLRGKAFRYTAHYPDGKTEVLLDVPRYDFNWQNAYEFTEPKLMPANTVLRCEAAFDNSSDNLANPDPSSEVRWGDQTWEEMMIGYFDAASAAQDLTLPSDASASRTRQFLDLMTSGKASVDSFFASADNQKLAREALQDSDSLMKFGLKLRELVPQLDRICYTTVRDGKLAVQAVAQEEKLAKSLGRAGVSLRSEGTGLAECAAADKTTVYARLARRLRPDLRFMSRQLGSSAHVPLAGDFGPGSINFWSTEEDAFPADAVAILERAVKVMTGAE